MQEKVEHEAMEKAEREARERTKWEAWEQYKWDLEFWQSWLRNSGGSTKQSKYSTKCKCWKHLGPGEMESQM